MPTYCLLVEYAGDGFAGWQVQAPGAHTVQGCLVDALERITGERTVVMGSGRTDAGVHAEAQVASFRLERPVEPEKLQRGLNGVLPREVAVRGVRGVFLDIVKIGRDAWAAVRKTCAVAIRINQAATVASLGRWRNVVCKSRL